MRILISVLTVNDIGGISTSLCNFLNYLTNENDVDLCVLCNYISPKVSLPKGVNIVKGSSIMEDCYVDRKDLSNQSAVRKLRRNAIKIARRIIGLNSIIKFSLRSFTANKEYDVSIAFTNDLYDKGGRLWVGGCYDLIKNNITSKCRIAWIHNDANKCGFTPEIANHIFNGFDSIVHVSENNKKVFDKIAPKYESKSSVVYNFYNIDEILLKSKEIPNPYSDNGKIHFVTVCRMYEEQKKVSRILETIKRLRDDFFDNFDWTLVGTGGDIINYQKYIEENELKDIVHFIGLKKNPYPYMLHADAFVLTSLYEGFGMTIKESQILGTPTFVTDFGPSHEAVIAGKQGEICPNSTDGVYDMIKKLLENPEKIENYRAYLSEHPVNNEDAIQQFESIVNKQ